MPHVRLWAKYVEIPKFLCYTLVDEHTKGGFPLKKHFPFFPLLAIFLTCLYPCAFVYLNNVKEAFLTDMLPMLGVFCLMGLLLFVLGLLLLRRADAAGLFSALSMLFFTNSGLLSSLLKSVLPWMRDRYVLLFGALLLAGLFVLLFRKRTFPAMECCMILSVLFATLTLIRVIPAAPAIIDLISFRSDKPQTEYTVFEGDRPNVYFFLLDEYGGSKNMERYYDFDNEDFLSHLEEQGFNVSHSSKNTDSIWTSTIVPNLMNLGYYVVDSQPERLRCSYLDDPLLTQIFQENGYTVNLISHKDFIRISDSTLLHEKQVPDRIGEYILANSVFAQLPKAEYYMKSWLGAEDLWQQKNSTQEIFDAMIGCVEQVGDEPTLTVSYVQSPHWPFLFNENGEFIYGGSEFLDHSIYLGQLTYVNSVLTEAVDNILEKDPDSIIVIQSDHGPRYPGQVKIYHNGPEYDPYVETPYMQNILNCIYYRGRPLDFEGETGINTWRLLLNEAFGTELESIPAPEGYISYGDTWDDLFTAS